MLGPPTQTRQTFLLPAEPDPARSVLANSDPPAHSNASQVRNVSKLPRSMMWRIEENLLLKLAVKRLQQEESDQHQPFEFEHHKIEIPTHHHDEESTSANNWETTLFSPLYQDHAPHHASPEVCHPHHVTVSFATGQDEIVDYPPADSSVLSSSNITKSLGDLTAATEAESHLISTDAESHADFEEDYYHSVQVEWEDANELVSCPRILTPTMMQHLHDQGIPEALQGNRWERCFAIGRDGDSFISFLDRCAPYRQTLVVIQTTEGHILGGFAAQPWCAQEGYGKRNSYYGTGQSFLFCSHPDTSVTNEASQAEQILHIFKWTGLNDYCQICDVEESKIAMGGGGNFGLIVEDGFWRGQTGCCGTYGNPSLVPSGFFEVAAFEVYGLVPLFQSFHSSNGH